MLGCAGPRTCLVNLTAPPAGAAKGGGGQLKPCEGTASPDGLASRLALHALVFQNARAIAALWARSAPLTLYSMQPASQLRRQRLAKKGLYKSDLHAAGVGML